MICRICGFYFGGYSEEWINIYRLEDSQDVCEGCVRMMRVIDWINENDKK